MLIPYDMERLLRNYDLGKLRAIRLASHGLVNETSFIETSRGRYVVRRNQPKIGRASILLRHRLLTWLRARGFPAPRLIVARSGETAIELDGRLCELATFIDGDEFNPDRPAHLVGTGALLARYHDAVIGFPSPPPAQGPRYTPLSLHGLIERVMQRDVMGDLIELLSWYDRRAADLQRLLPEPVYGALPSLLIHGDIHRDNLIFRGDTVVALIDFDQVTIDARLVDLADALVDFAVGRPPADWYPWGVYAGPLDTTRVRALLDGYTQALPLSGAEREALPVLVEVVWLQGNLRRVLMTADADVDYHLELLDQGRSLSLWLNERHSLLTTN